LFGPAFAKATSYAEATEDETAGKLFGLFDWSVNGFEEHPKKRRVSGASDKSEFQTPTITIRAAEARQ